MRAGYVRFLAVLACAASRRASASELRVQSHTVSEAYMVRAPSEEGQLLSRRRIVQQVQLGVYNLLRPRDPREAVRAREDGQLQVVASLRLRHDFGTFTRQATGATRGLVQAEDGRQIDMMFGYLEGQNLGNRVDFRLGRQFEFSGLDFYGFDGGFVKVHTPARFAVEAFGGLAVDGSDVFGVPSFELDGTEHRPRNSALSPTFGTALTTSRVRWIDARVGYRRTMTPETPSGGASLDPSAPEADRVPSVFSVVNQELVTGQVSLHPWKGMVSPYAALRYNVAVGRVDDVWAGLRVTLAADVMARAEYLRTLPTFDADSVFSVFAMTPIEETRLVLNVRLSPTWNVSARGQLRIFRDDPTTLQSRPATAMRLGAGGGAALMYRSQHFALRGDVFAMAGEGGDRLGARLDTRTHVLWDRIALDARVYAVGYRDDRVPTEPGYSVSAQAGVDARLWTGVHLNVMGEELTTPFFRHAMRFLAVLSVDASVRVGRRPR